MKDTDWKPVVWMVLVILYGFAGGKDVPLWIIVPLGIAIGFVTASHMRWMR